jgi:hypothetical protein
MLEIDWDDVAVMAVVCCPDGPEAWWLLQDYGNRTKRPREWRAAVWSRRREMMAERKIERRRAARAARAAQAEAPRQ